MNRRYAKKMKTIFFFLALWCLVSSPSHAQTVVPDDFAYGMPIDTVGGQPVQSLIVPQVVYENLALNDLADVRVFNGDGVPVPHAVHSTVERSELPAVNQELPIFPIYGRLDESLDNLNVRVRRDAAGTIIQLDDRVGAGASLLRAYLADASQFEAAASGLAFFWSDTPDDLLVRLTAETSDDLQNWQSWGSSGTLASMQHDEQVLIRNTLTLPARKARYYRLSWPASVSFPPLSRLEIVTAPTRLDAERYWLSVPLATREEGEFAIEMNPVLPLDRIQIDLPETQQVVRVRLTSSQEEGGPVVQHFQGVAYHLDAGEESWKSPAIQVDSRGHQFWTLTLLQGDEPMQGGAPSLRLGWTPARVLFVPQGNGPFTLAYGNASAEPASFTSQELFLPIQSEFEDVFEIPLALTGVPVELGGPTRLEAVDEVPWEQMVLWGSLIAGVVLLAFLSVRLLRQAGSQAENGDG